MKNLSPFSIRKRLLTLMIGLLATVFVVQASSHREAPLISNDPLADNTDLYAFRSPDNPNTVTIIANYIPGQLPFGGPNYYTFGEKTVDKIVSSDHVKLKTGIWRRICNHCFHHQVRRHIPQLELKTSSDRVFISKILDRCFL